MFLLLFSILLGGIITLILCAPYSYYPLFCSLFGASIIIFILSRKYLKVASKSIYAVSLILFFSSYTLCSYLIFKPADFHYSGTNNLSKYKKAVIFYCEGEMEKYTPYYANYFFKQAPLILKPIYSMNIKKIYKDIDVNSKNKDLLNVALDVKNSILNYGPYYFYIAFSCYVPDIKDAIHSAISDGCSDITIINYSSNENLSKEIEEKISLENLNSNGISVKFTRPVYFTDSIVEVLTSRIINMPLKWDAVLLMDNENSTSSGIKASLIEFGYKDAQILISSDIPSSMKYFKENNFKNILYVNLSESSSGIKADVLIPKEFEKYSKEYKISGIKSWGYDNRLAKAAIKAFLEVQKK